jgi:hypothetical protein
MQSSIISIEQVYLEAFALCVYLMGLGGLDWKYMNNLLHLESRNHSTILLTVQERTANHDLGR